MNIYKAITEEVLVPIHPAGWPFIFLFVLASILITVFWSPFAVAGTLLSLWCVYFFRNPRRTTPVTENLVIAPADGRVLSTGPADPPADLDLPAGDWRRVAIFMNVFDVHVNRAPVSGMVTATSYHKGAFVNASLDKAAEANRHCPDCRSGRTPYPSGSRRGRQAAGWSAIRDHQVWQPCRFVAAGKHVCHCIARSADHCWRDRDRRP